jgi:hypothetical protein
MNRKERDSNDYMYENESISDLVTIGSVVAVSAEHGKISLLLQKPTCRVLWSLGMRSFVEIS